VKERLQGSELASIERVRAALKDEIKAIFAAVPNRPLALVGDGPRVVVIVGVNGSGKTTTIGKLAHAISAEGKTVLLGAGDTFRAAAADQLTVWGQRAGVAVVEGKDGADPASVLFDAVERAERDGIDVVLCDTAGRLHTKVNLMEELKKVQRVLAKAQSGAPHEVLLVLDATVGQNAIAQAKEFGAAVPLTGIVLTKLDGTAKGGVVLGICDELKVPIRYIGLGERAEDLREFVPGDFVEALFGRDEDETSAKQDLAN
jgi:fused signal recognition particle receptor